MIYIMTSREERKQCVGRKFITNQLISKLALFFRLSNQIYM